MVNHVTKMHSPLFSCHLSVYNPMVKSVNGINDELFASHCNPTMSILLALTSLLQAVQCAQKCCDWGSLVQCGYRARVIAIQNLILVIQLQTRWDLFKVTACSCTSKLLVFNYTSPSAITTFSYGAKSSRVQSGVFNIHAFFWKDASASKR